MTTLAPPALLAALSGLDWNDLPAVTAASTEVLDRLAADRALLGELTSAVSDNPHFAAAAKRMTANQLRDRIVALSEGVFTTA